MFIVRILPVANGVTLQSAEDAGSGAYMFIGAVFFVVALCFILASPYIIVFYTGKILGTHAWLFGFEGYMDIATIEQHIFGADMGYLEWSTNGRLSRMADTDSPVTARTDQENRILYVPMTFSSKKMRDQLSLQVQILEFFQ